MLLSKELLLSDDQAITDDAASTNYIDIGAPGTPPYGAAALSRDHGKGEPVPFLVQVTEAFLTCDSVTFALQTDDNTSFSSALTVFSQTILVAALVVGKKISIQHLPEGINERYFRMYYTVNGSNATAGKITAGVSMGNQSNFS